MDEVTLPSGSGIDQRLKLLLLQGRRHFPVVTSGKSKFELESEAEIESGNSSVSWQSGSKNAVVRTNHDVVRENVYLKIDRKIIVHRSELETGVKRWHLLDAKWRVLTSDKSRRPVSSSTRKSLPIEQHGAPSHWSVSISITASTV